jgi:endogenous inhibitor of DNA gyrase (YacG/DUF329 family)
MSNPIDLAGARPRTPKCPTCGRPPQPATKPFCSKRCHEVDLSRWLHGVYRVPVTEDEDEDGTKDSGPPPEVS